MGYYFLQLGKEYSEFRFFRPCASLKKKHCLSVLRVVAESVLASLYLLLPGARLLLQKNAWYSIPQQKHTPRAARVVYMVVRKQGLAGSKNVTGSSSKISPCVDGSQ